MAYQVNYYVMTSRLIAVLHDNNTTAAASVASTVQLSDAGYVAMTSSQKSMTSSTSNNLQPVSSVRTATNCLVVVST